MQGSKTHEQQLRILDRKPDHPGTPAPYANPDVRQSEFPISRGGMNQESDHNKHNDPGQPGHKPQVHTPAEEKKA
jgi:hypothetical protein